jgi:hypothetical protein
MDTYLCKYWYSSSGEPATVLNTVHRRNARHKSKMLCRIGPCIRLILSNNPYTHYPPSQIFVIYQVLGNFIPTSPIVTQNQAQMQVQQGTEKGWETAECPICWSLHTRIYEVTNERRLPPARRSETERFRSWVTGLQVLTPCYPISCRYVSGNLWVAKPKLFAGI